MIRYVHIAILCAAIAAALAVTETLLSVSGSGLSIFDTRGAGQVLLLAVPLVMITLFSMRAPGGDPIGFARLYVTHWRRALAGFFWFWLVITLLIAGAYVAFGLAGLVRLSDAGLAGLGWRVALNTGIALLVVVVLATTEELIFRGFLMRYLTTGPAPASVAAAVVVAALVFAVLHNLTDPLAWFRPDEATLLAGLFCLAVLLSVTYIATGSITCAIAVHAAFLGSKVFLRRTGIVEVDHAALFLQNSADLRESPLVWALWLALALVIFLLRRPLRARFAIETGLHGMAPTPYRRDVEAAREAGPAWR